MPYMLNNMYMFVSETIPAYKTLKDEAIAFYSISGLNDGTGTVLSLPWKRKQHCIWMVGIVLGDTQSSELKYYC